jgi:serine/threonine protein kinase
MDIYELEKNGSLFDGWHVVRPIGEGGFGSVYEIEREEFGVKMRSALKVISIPKNRNDVSELMSEGMDEQSASNYFREYVEELSSECSLMLKLKGNSNIVSFEDYKVVEHKGEIGWDILIRMEILTPLIQYMNTHTLNFSDVLDIGISMCEALSLCQKHHIMHRDIKPANIFVSENGDYKLGDFGISRIVEKSNGASTRVGTMDYIAPEVFRGERYDSRVDIYSLGLVLYRLMNNNRLPFLPPAPQPITQSQREEANAKRMSGLKVPKPEGMSNTMYEILARATAFSPDERYQNANQFLTDLLNMKKMTMPQSAGFATVTGNMSGQSTGDSGAAAGTDRQVNIPPVQEQGYVPTQLFTPEDEESLGKRQMPPIQEQQRQTPPSPQIITTPPVNPTPRVNPVPPTPPMPSMPRKKSKAPLVLGIVAGILALLIIGGMAISKIGGDKDEEVAYNTSTASDRSSRRSDDSEDDSSEAKETAAEEKTTEEASSDKTEEPVSGESKAGKLIIQAQTVLKGDTINTQYIAGDIYLFWSDQLKYTSSDESVAIVRRSKDGQRFVIEGVGAGVATITGTYGEYSASADIRVVDFDGTNVLDELGYDKTNLYGYMLDLGLSADQTYTMSKFGKQQIPFGLFDVYDTMGIEIGDYANGIYYYCSENIRLGVDAATEGGSLVITLTDLGGYPTEGELTVLVTDVNDENAFCAYKIPVKVE